MVSGLTPPSNRKDINDSNKNTESLRDVMPFIPDSRNAQVGSSLFGQAPLSVPNISGQFSITPYEAVESVLLKLVKLLFYCYRSYAFRGSSVVEQSAVNRSVVSSNLTRGAI